MDIIGHHLQPVRETSGMNLQIPLLIAPVEETVINVDIRISHIFQPLAEHGVGLFPYQFLTDMDTVGIP